jgi:hypothetical protein
MFLAMQINAVNARPRGSGILISSTIVMSEECYEDLLLAMLVLHALHVYKRQKR